MFSESLLNITLWSFLAGSGLFVGAIMSLTLKLSHRLIARTMAFGSGVLLSMIAFEMIARSRTQIDSMDTFMALFIGSLLFGAINRVMAKKGAELRKRCGECVQQPSEESFPGSGMAIAVGTIIDGIPEGLILGLSLTSPGTPSLIAGLGFALANVPESLSATAGMKQAGRSKRYIMTLWILAVVVTILSAIVASTLLQGVGGEFSGWMDAIAAGLLFTMVAETMLPEAVDQDPSFVGLFAVIGFGLIASMIAH